MKAMKNLSIRPAKSTDPQEIQSVFVDTVSSVCKNDYSPEQIRVWTASVTNTYRWLERLASQYFLIAEIEGKIRGFASLENSDYLDLLYVHKDFQRQGIANALYSAIEEEAQRRGAKSIFSDVSITAKSFFERQGFEVLKFQTHIIDGIEIKNYKMRKELKVCEIKWWF